MNSTYIIFLIINILFIRYFDKISFKISLYDRPDNLRKLHKNRIACIGGILIITNFIIFFFVNKFQIFEKGNFVFFLGSLLFFIIGFVDDHKSIKANIKLILFILAFGLIIYFDQQLILNEIRFSFKIIQFNNIYISYFITILCFLLFVNSFNMFDGINLQSGFYALFIFIIFILNNIFLNFSLVISFSILTFLFLNFKNKCFLGDNGSLLIGFIISYIFLKSEFVFKNLYADQIFLIMLVPGVDLLRIAIKRIIKNKHPFDPDRNHIHHILQKNFSYNMSIFITICLIVIPNFLSLFYKNYFVLIFLTSVIYFSLIIYKKK